MLEGLDGAGTTTQAARLGDWLACRGRRVHLTAEPSRGPVGASIRHVLSGRLRGAGGGAFDPGALALLFAADRLDHWRERDPSAPGGRGGRGLGPLRALQPGLPGGGHRRRRLGGRHQREGSAPDLTVFLRVRPAVALRRRYAATAEREIFEVPEFQRRVHRAYGRALARLVESGERIAVLSGEKPVDRVAEEVAGAVGNLPP